MLDKMKKTREAAIALRPNQTGTGGTRFGGPPNLSPQIRWPKDAAGRPMHHLLQLDCAALPVVDSDMPTTGTLSIFVAGSFEDRQAPSIMDGENGAFYVLYQEAMPADLPERPHPETCPALGEDSLACDPVRYTVETKKMGFFQRLVNTQPKAYSKSGGTGYFSALPLEATAIDSCPMSDGDLVLDALGVAEKTDAQEDGRRALQVLGYAPRYQDIKTAHIAGYRSGSDEKARAAYDMRDPDDVLLAQFAHDPALNLDLLRAKYALQFRISRADLRARAFECAYVTFDNFGLDGVWWPSENQPDIDYGGSEDFAAELAFKPLTPFEKPRSASNYVCGTPQLPPDIDWPCRADGYPLGFLMQVDCASLPRSVTAQGATYDLPDFPETGTIFLFVDDFLEDVGPDSIQVIYTPETTQTMPTRTPPAALQTLPDFADHNIKIRATYGEVPLPEPKRPFDPVAFVSIASPIGGEPNYKTLAQARRRYGDVFPHEDKAFPGVQMLLDWLPNYKAAIFGPYWSPRLDDARSPLRAIEKGFPWLWSDIRSATEYFPQDRFDRVAEDLREVVFGSDLIAQGNAWKQKSREHGPLERISQDDRTAYRQWLLSMDKCATTIPPETQNEGAADRRKRMDLEDTFERLLNRLVQPYSCVEYRCLPDTLHHLAYNETTGDLPDDMREIVAETVRFHRSNTKLRGNSQLHNPNPDLMFSRDPQGQTSDTEILLFSLASGACLPVNWGDCWRLHIWIEAADLASGRFDRISAKIKV